VTAEPREKRGLPDEFAALEEADTSSRRSLDEAEQLTLDDSRSKRLRWANRRRPRRSQKAEYRRPARGLKREAGGMALIVTGVVILFASSTPSPGIIPTLLKSLLGTLVGELGSGIVALALMFLGTAILVGHSAFRATPVAAGLGMLFLCFITLWQMGVARDGLVGRIWSQEPGGLIGLLLAEILKPLFGRTWGTVVLAVGCLCAIVQITGASLASIFQRVGRAVFAAVIPAWQWLGAHLRRRSHLQRLERKGAASVEARQTARRQVLPAVVPISPPPAEKPLPAVPAAKAPAEETEKEAVEAEDASLSSEEIKSGYDEYVLPDLSLLSRTVRQPAEGEHEETINRMEILEQTLSSFGIKAKVVEIERGPRVTRYEIRCPRGIRVSRISNLADDLAYSLSALDVRVEAPVPGKGVIGIEVPNSEAVFVDLVEILSSEEAQNNKSPLAFALGKDITGNPRIADLTKMPHLLIAGATNSGKSVCLNSVIASFLFRTRPDEVKLLLIDPKRVELSLFSGIPHLVAPVAHDVKEAAGLLRWAIREMEHRYEVFAEAGVRNIAGYNEQAQIDDELEPMWYLVIIVDELADLMMQAKGEFEASICRLAQLARATGIHLVVATQRPSVNVITGTIKANISSRIAFAVASQADSRVILDMNGAERLVGSGDMLYLPIDEAKPARIQGAYICEKDIGRLMAHLKEQARPEYSAEAVAAEKTGCVAEGQTQVEDELFGKALEYVLSTKYASASMLQRRMRIGYTRAARLIDIMEEKGYIGPPDGSKPREVYVSPPMASGG
jgi:S-DNA-T family DNA segregation ATPase FtsK/SpoIIIE